MILRGRLAGWISNMIMLLIIGGVIAMITLFLGFLPDSGYLVMSQSTIIVVVAKWLSYFMGLFGDNIKNTMLVAGGWYLSVRISIFVLDVIRFFRVPIISRVFKE